jgi:hypothetical protein
VRKFRIESCDMLNAGAADLQPLVGPKQRYQSSCFLHLFSYKKGLQLGLKVLCEREMNHCAWTNLGKEDVYRLQEATMS